MTDVGLRRYNNKVVKEKGEEDWEMEEVETMRSFKINVKLGEKQD